ncbi:hypothetical protein L596_000018 [Steinernema carpocapsae]|uniref:Uncharacterized protein n=1 Tax=Steinernema carpocapsae TaxID=34508 RepID=A0A4V6I6W3_STECR|nr:hypothetical protein L596_000018 [Steinernema carpocapsae]
MMECSTGVEESKKGWRNPTYYTNVADCSNTAKGVGAIQHIIPMLRIAPAPLKGVAQSNISFQCCGLLQHS